MRQKDGHIVSYGTYIAVWFGLLVFTILTVAVAGINIRVISVIAPLLIAAIKTLLVLSFFMHLKYEDGNLKMMLSGAVVILAIIIGFTFLDISFR